MKKIASSANYASAKNSHIRKRAYDFEQLKSQCPAGQAMGIMSGKCVPELRARQEIARDTGGFTALSSAIQDAESLLQKLKTLV